MEKESLDTESDGEENPTGELEGAVGYAPNQAPIPLPPHLVNHHPLLDPIYDSENNNVDENSNDHQYDEYANYHQQYQHEYVRNQCESPLSEQDDSANIQNVSTPRSTPRTPTSTHRRIFSADFSYSANNSRHEVDSGNRRYPQLPNRRTLEVPSTELVRQEAEELLCNFTAEEFRSEKLEPPQGIAISGFSNPAWVSAGRDLRMLADAFSKSHERQFVRRRAEKVNLTSITMENFFTLLGELFQGGSGVSQERIVVLFTFISDVAIQHVRRGAQRLVRQLMDWSLEYVWHIVCDWVRDNGGWGAVLSQGANLALKWSLACVLATAAIALGIYIRNSL